MITNSRKTRVIYREKHCKMQRTTPHQIRWLILPTLLFLLITGCNQQKDKEITSTGTLEMTEFIISTRTGGSIAEILVGEGERVHAGDLLLRLDHQELDDQLTSAMAALESAQVREAQAKINLELSKEQYAAQIKQATANQEVADEQIRLLENGARRQELEMAKSSVEQTKAHLELAKKNYSRYKSLFSEGLIAQAQLDQALTQKLTAEAQYHTALNSLSIVQAGVRSEELSIAKSQGKSAEAGLELVRSNERMIRLRQEEISLVAAQIRQAEANIQLLKTQIERHRITAPANGVISARLVELGENTAPGATLFTLLNPDESWLKVYLPLTQVERINLGDKAQIKLDAFPNRIFTGTVVNIASEAEFTPRNFQTKEERVRQVFAVKIHVDNSSGLLKPGMPADADIFPTS